VEPFGEYLKKERESRSISLEEISKSTKIRKVFLEAIERSDLDKLPPDVIVKGFLRSYAEYLGLDMVDVVLRFQNHLEYLRNEEEIEYPPYKKSYLSKSYLVILILILVFVFGFFMFVIF
jgi:cytoskeletal protein RodZ